MQNVMVTGAAGQVAGFLRPFLRKRFARLILTDRVDPGALEPGEEFHPADLNDADALSAAMDGVEGVIHLGGQPTEADWDTVHAANIAGLYTFYKAARASGVTRIVYASSVHAVGFYDRETRIDEHARTRPDGYYGVSKALGEALASLYADKHGLRTLSIRIGNVNLTPIDTRRLSIWVHPEDLFQLCEIGLTHADIHNQIVFGMSDNARGWWDNATAFGLGYAPRHRSEDHVEVAQRGDGPPDAVGDLFQGGTFCSDGFSGDLERTRRH